MDPPAFFPQGFQGGQKFVPAMVHSFPSWKLMQDIRFNGIDNTQGLPLGRHSVNPDPGIGFIMVNTEYVVRQPVPVVEITKKPSV
jgi:hypothetical protein